MLTFGQIQSPITMSCLLWLAFCGLVLNFVTSHAIVDCDFEKDKCGWVDGSGDFTWTRRTGGTPSSGTGPSGDHTTGFGHYMYIETSSPRQAGDIARLTTNTSLPSNKAMSLSFWYHMYGNYIATLTVYTVDDSNRITTLFNKSGNQNQTWHQALIHIHALPKNFKIVIQGSTGRSFQGDIAIDDIQELFKPVINKTLSRTNITSWHGKNVTLRCGYSIALPVPTWKWYRPNGDLITSGVRNITNGSEITVTTRQDKSDYGGYRCNATNIAGSDEHTIYVKQLFKPVIEKTLSDTNVTSWNGNYLKLRCQYLIGLPVPTWKWYQPNGDLITSNVYNITSGSEVTVITGQESSDYGRYTCIATNTLGSDRHNITVTQLYLPSKPRYLDVISIQPSSAVITWIRPEYGNPITGYEILVNSTILYSNMSAFVNHKEIKGLLDDTLYEVNVISKNYAGYSNASVKVFRTSKQVGNTNAQSTHETGHARTSTIILGSILAVLCCTILASLILVAYLVAELKKLNQENGIIF